MGTGKVWLATIPVTKKVSMPICILLLLLILQGCYWTLEKYMWIYPKLVVLSTLGIEIVCSGTIVPI